MADLKDRSDVPQAGGVTGKRDIIVSPNIYRWAVEGKIFEAGFGLEDTAINSSTTVADTTPTFALQAPNSAALLVVPILLKLFITADGGGLQTYAVSFTKPSGLCATSMTLSGTALTSKHSSYRANPAPTSQQAIALSGVTASALVAADYVQYHGGHSVDAAITSGLVTMGSGPSNAHIFSFLKEGAPHIMTSGAAMLVHCDTTSSASTWTCFMQWAEVTKDDLY